MRFELLDLGIGTIRFSSWRGLYFSGGTVFILFSLFMWFAEKPLMSFMEGDGASTQICKRLSHSADPRLNIATKVEDYGVNGPCRASVSAYIPKTADLSAISGQVQLFDESGSVDAQSSLRLDLRSGGTGMMTADTVLPAISGKACISLRAELKLNACYSNTGQKIDCPPVRVADNPAFQEFKVGGEDLNICYDQ